MLTGMQDYKMLWMEALYTVAYVHNRILTDSTNMSMREKTPYELLTGKKPDLSHLRIFSSEVNVKKPQGFVCQGKF